MPAKLSVNLNAIAQLRNRRNLPWPSVAGLGLIALQSGAHGLTVHPRPDQRHIRFTDLPVLRKLTHEFESRAEFNIEGYPTDHFIGLCCANAPDQVTLVPDDPAQATSDHGWRFVESRDTLCRVVEKLKKKGARVSLFADGNASMAELRAAASTGADRIELYTGPYGACYDDPAKKKEIALELGQTAIMAHELGLGVNAGHDLTVANLPLLARQIPHLAEVSIGHGLTADALEFGMRESVLRFRRACGEPV
ncbi:pyridoxine 5'-phosphate synthase [Martelella alba]|uniref:Pyridoxine 5'-phosphate synthase n=1 Tax=Martelella alba TaxID=2590451 RepID=A0A506UIM1_9HYPH|nr:pyridoxine 5'-phosphate synthase [Martelella alba]TPW33156.1 pyridoxine 5'-phosphate synthase [Martelella alba]